MVTTLNPIYGTNRADILHDTSGFDRLVGKSGADILTFDRDLVPDVIGRFELGVDKIDLTSWGVVFDEVMFRFRRDDLMVLDIRGEKFHVHIDQENSTKTSWSADDFIFDEFAAPVFTQAIQDQFGPTKMTGSSRPDEFVLSPDGQRDVIRDFEAGKDQINLQAFGLQYDELKFAERVDGRFVIWASNEPIVLIDASRQFTPDDVSADWFIL